LEEILDRIGGNWDLLQSVVALFEEDHPGQLVRIREAIDSGDATALAASAHTLKGSLLVLAADRAAAAALELERMARESRLAAAPTAFAALELEIKAVSAELQKILRERLSVAAN
jgi:HPt (histidine-containing phosphotransfer) domain-containing protein